MKIKLIITLLLQFSISMLSCQVFKPTANEALINTTVINNLKRPIQGAQISFTSKKNGDIFKGVTNDYGKFSILLPIGSAYVVEYLHYTKNVKYNEFIIPDEPALYTWDLNIVFEPTNQDSVNNKTAKNEVLIQSKDTVNNEESNMYYNLSSSLKAICEHSYLTVFCNIDVNFAYSNFRFYLENYMNLASIDYKFDENRIIDKYVPSISSDNNEYLQVNMFLKKTDNIQFVKLNNDKCTTIVKCEIIGSTDLIIKLFVNYWPLKIKYAKYKQGEIAHYDLFGDKITLYGISVDKCKIVISDNQLNSDYSKMFGK